MSDNIKEDNSSTLFNNLIWLSVREAAIYLRILKDDGEPSEGAIRNLVYRNKLKAYKPNGRLLFSRRELDEYIENSLINQGGFV